jgi:phytoene synthase
MLTLEDPVVSRLRRHDRDRFLATLFAPAERRPGLWALLAFNFEIARIRETVSQKLLGQIRLQWWREVLEQAYGGHPVRRHEIATPLAGSIRRWGIGRAGLEAMIDGRERDLDDRPLADLAELAAYAEATSSRLVESMLPVLGVAGDPAHEAARHAGRAWALVGLVRAEPYRQAPFLPPDPQGLVPAAARKAIEAARALRRSVPRTALPALLPLRLADRYLGRIERRGHDPRAAALPDPLAAARLSWGRLVGRY